MSHQLLQEYNSIHQKEGDSEVSPESEILYNITQTPDIQKINVDEAWELIESEIKVRPLHSATRKSVFGNWLKVAVVAIILGAFGLTYYYGYDQRPETNQSILLADEGVKKFQLPDNSIVWLGKNSELTVNDRFLEDRKVSLTGEAFFDVEKNKSTFTIVSGSATIEVLGTSFNVNSREESKTQVIVTEGLVKVSGVNSSTEVEAGKVATLDIESDKITVSDQDNKNALAWKTGRFEFENTSLKEVVNYLNTYYEQKVEVKGRVAQCQVTGLFEKMPLQDVIEELALILSLKVKKSGETYILSGEGC